MNFIFGGDTGQTYEQVQRRRQIADELMAQGGTPRTTGEGIASFAKQISGALIGRKADKRDDALRSEANQLWDSSMGSIFGGGGSMPSASPMGAATPPVSTGPIPTEGDLLGNDAMAAIGRTPNNPTASIMPASLIQTESGGNFAALNNEVGHGGVAGHGGRGQFGHARLQDAAAAGIIPPGTTPQQFAQMPPEQQIAVENWHFSDIDKAIDDVGAVGRNIGGVTMTRDALRSVAHLGGVGGMKKFVATNGEYNPADSFGTSLMDYAGTHSGGGAAPQGAQGGGQPNISTQQIVELLSNPYIRQDPAKAAVLQSLLQQNMQGQDPMRQMEMERARLELEQLRNPQPDLTATQREYAAAQQQGFEGTFLDYQTALAEAKRSNTDIRIDTGQGPQPELLGTQGLVAIPDPTVEGGYRIQPAPGSPLALEQEAAAAAGEVGAENQAVGAVNVLEVLDNLKSDIETNPRTTTGFVGRMLSGVAGSAAYDAEATSKTIKANLAFDALAAMRAASPTGGALGAVSERELALLESQIASLDLGQSKDRIMDNIERIQDQYTRLLNKAYETGDPAALDAAFGGRPDFVQIGGTTAAQGGVPEGIDPAVWDVMTPEEKALWQN